MSNKDIEIYSEALKRKEKEKTKAWESTRDSTYPRDRSRDNPRGQYNKQSRDEARGKSREKPRDLPTRDEIQEFSFQLRDEIKVKVQAEVPYHWQDELEEMSRKMNVKKLELYRFIIGEFLGKVQRKKGS